MSTALSHSIVRKAARSDVGTLVELMRQFYAEASYPLEKGWAANAFSYLLARPELGCVWLAEYGDAVAGHAVLTVRYTMEHGAMSGHIDDLFVRPRFRRRGIGRALVAELLAECRHRDCRSIYVEVGDRSSAAIELYRGMGLEPFEDGRLLLHASLGNPGD